MKGEADIEVEISDTVGGAITLEISVLDFEGLIFSTIVPGRRIERGIEPDDVADSSRPPQREFCLSFLDGQS